MRARESSWNKVVTPEQLARLPCRTTKAGEARVLLHEAKQLRFKISQLLERATELERIAHQLLEENDVN